ncbi:chloride channel protein [Comamonadaceae bacterium OH2545_COT-014]|nr:chloride channel protein [Comamonadaceae bacterium OH2545_COT-014]
MKRHAARHDPDFYRQLRAELSDGWRWVDRAVVLAYGALAGVVVVVFTLLSHMAFDFFGGLYGQAPLLALLWTPLVTAGIVWLTRRFVPAAGGSGIPQVVAALEPGLDAAGRHWFVSLKLSAAKVLLGSAGLLGGLSVGREGPSVQVAAGVMLHCQRWFRHRQSMVSPHALLVAGGAAGIAAAFNAPLAGVVFAIEELSRRMESRYSGVILASIVLAGLIGVSAFGNTAYFGTVQVPPLGWSTLLPGVAVAVLAGLAGGVFSRLMIASLTGSSGDRFTAWRRRYPIRFAAGIGLAIAVIGLATGGQTFGSGTEAARELLHGQVHDAASVYGLLKFVTTWLTAWSGVPGGIFAPSLSVGAGIGYNVSSLAGGEVNTALIAMGMAGFLAAVTQTPLTSFIIVMEMIDGRPMVLSLMAVAMTSAAISRMISRPLYATLAAFMLAQLRARQASAAARPEAESEPSGGPAAPAAPAFAEGARPVDSASPASPASAAPAPAAPSPAAATAPPAPP